MMDVACCSLLNGKEPYKSYNLRNTLGRYMIYLFLYFSVKGQLGGPLIGVSNRGTLVGVYTTLYNYSLILYILKVFIIEL